MDLISRQEAIGAFWELNIELRPSCIDAIIDMLKCLPSAQPERCEDCVNFNKTRLLIPQSEIIRCKDCKHYKALDYTDKLACHYVIGGTVIRKPDDFCSRAERRTDE